ncbi:MAG: chromosome segregation protein SMC, partial [Pseudomonadota bacterium]
ATSNASAWPSDALALEVASETARNSASILQDREATLSEKTEDTARLVARHQSAARYAQDCEKALSSATEKATRAKDAMGEARQSVEQSEAALELASEADREAQTAVTQSEAALAAAEAARTDAQSAESNARATRSEADGEASAIKAEVQALARLVERDTGTRGTVLDQVSVTRGYEKALGAALADDLKAALVERDGSGWRTLPGYSDAAALPGEAEPLDQHVNGPDALGRRLSQIGVVEGEQGARLQSDLQPGQRLVSIAGDLWRWDGFVATAADAPSAAAIRLEQINRLTALQADLSDAETKVEAARAQHDRKAQDLKAATEADQAARAARRSADQRRAEAARALSKAESEKTLAEGRVETLSLAVTRHEEEQTAARGALAQAEAAVKALPDVEATRAELEDVKATVEAARMTMMTHRAAHDELRRVGDARTKRSQEITKDISGWRHRLETAEARAAELQERKAKDEEALAEATSAPDEIAAKRAELADAIDEAETRRKAAADALALSETALREASIAEREAERAAGVAREDRARAEARMDAARETVALAVERIAEAQDVTPQDLLTELDVDPDTMPSSDRIEADVARLRRQRDSLGAVNLRAEEDAREVAEERDSLAAEKEDLEAAISALRTGIASLNKEGRERLLAAFDEVNRSFSVLFTHLFGGGEAKLVLVESDDPLEAGLEIMCQPPGKKLSTLSLLSGGEQTLTALALIFAVFLANPAPICVLDEVDAPLDDANVTRFCDLLDEMTRRTNTRFLIITHHAVTMSRMDRLFGVTMQEQGVSQLVSVDLRDAEQLVA